MSGAVCIRCDQTTTHYILDDGWAVCARCLAKEDES